MSEDLADGSGVEPTPSQVRRWRKYLAEERAEGTVYRSLAERRTGEERAILLGLADAEMRHEAYWLRRLGPHVGRPLRPGLSTRLLGWLAGRFGSVFVLALAQRAEFSDKYAADSDAGSGMSADEKIHGEVVRGLAERGRARISGTFRAAVFGMNDGLVSNLALILGIGATGVSTTVILATGLSGMLAGALSMGAGEYVSVRSQRELLESSRSDPTTISVVPELDIDANELSLVYRARGMERETAESHAADVIAAVRHGGDDVGGPGADHDFEEVGTGWGAAVSSFLFFASGAIIPCLPYLLGASGWVAVVCAAVLVGVALLVTGAVVGVLSGSRPLPRALRQLAIGMGAAVVTFLLGLAFGTTVS